MKNEDVSKLEKVVFALETVAHLQGKERLLLPMCDEAHQVLEKEKENNKSQ
jgi:hypothetical protein